MVFMLELNFEQKVFVQVVDYCLIFVCIYWMYTCEVKLQLKAGLLFRYLLLNHARHR